MTRLHTVIFSSFLNFFFLLVNILYSMGLTQVISRKFVCRGQKFHSWSAQFLSQSNRIWDLYFENLVKYYNYFYDTFVQPNKLI